ncbi:MAG: Na/Pi cotransporter family protein [Nitrospirae bacterium]|nr:Na/Pi cotransporter family protein [Nitrospirota bacterium]
MTNLMLFSLFGGMAILLYGMRLAGEGLQRAAGARLRTILSSLTKNRLLGLGIGIIVTVFLQSSTATIIMLVGFVGSGLMTLPQSIGVILGADIGTTITVQLLAFRIYDYAILFVGIGITMMFLSKRAVLKNIGEGILGFSFIFLSIKIMSDSLMPLKSSELFKTVLVALLENPILGLIISAVFTAIVHSSAAIIGLALALGIQGLITIDTAIPLIFGANIGTCATAIISSIGSNIDAKRVAASHTLFKVLGVLIFFPFIRPFADFIISTTDDIPRQIANAHTIFNGAIAILFLPFTSVMTDVIKRMVPVTAGEEKRFSPKYLDKRVLSSPVLAFGQAKRESLRMADIVHEMLSDSIAVFKNDDAEMIDSIEKRDDYVDLLDREIKLYLTRLSNESLTPQQSKMEQDLLAFINDLENIGDVVDKNLMELAKKKIKNGLVFSQDGMKEIEEFHKKILENFEIGASAFVSGDAELAKKLLQNKIALAEMERNLRQAHIQRLHRGLKESIDTSSIHLDVLSNLRRINSYISNVAYPIVEICDNL